MATTLLNRDGVEPVRESNSLAQLEGVRPGLPLDHDRVFGPLYRHLMLGDSLAELLDRLCGSLCELLQAPLVVVARKADNGLVVMEGASPETMLWAELKRLPERWDGTVAGDGPAARALKADAPAWLSVGEDGFLPWRAAAARDQVAAAGAWPIPTSMGIYVIEVFVATESFFASRAVRRAMSEVVRELRAFLYVRDRWHEERLLAAALEHCGNPSFVTDVHGEIVWANRALSRLYGYSPAELRGRNPRLLKSGRQGVRYYRDLWSTIRAGRVWRGETVDHDRNGVAYTVWQTISPFGRDGHVTHYLSMQEDISGAKLEQRKRNLKLVTDALTGLLTPEAFEREVTAAAAADGACTVIVVSLRDFAHALPAFGDDVSEAARAEINDRVREQIAPYGVACETAPGEYRLLLRQLPEAGTTTLTDALRAALAEPFPLLGDTLRIRPQFGEARAPEHGRSFEALVQFAERQLVNEPMARARRSLVAD